MVYLIKDEPPMVPQTELYSLKREALVNGTPARKLLNGLIKMVFTDEELATSKATDKGKTGVKPLDQQKCNVLRG